jgi:hypothetical protein
VNVRPLRSGDDSAIRLIFRSSLVLGQPMAFDPPALAKYEELCLGWYLGVGRDAARVLIDDVGGIAGYALVCTDEESHRRWTRRHAIAIAPRAIVTATRSAFWRARIRDAVVLNNAPRPASAHAHLNLVSGARAGRGAAMLLKAIDDVCAQAGHRAWYGEINARAGRRATALERSVGSVVHRVPNHTLSMLTGRPIERLTLLRSIDRAAA